MMRTGRPCNVLRPMLPAILLLVLTACSHKSTSTELTVTELHSDLGGLGVIWSMVFVAENQLLFSERAGRIGLLNLDSNRVEWIAGAPPVWATGQGGLLDIALPPGYSPDDWIYFTYSKPTGTGAATTLARARLAGTRLVGWQDVLVSDSASDKTQHFGSRIAFDGEGHVFFSVGERGHRANAQDLTNHAGKILRLNMDGSVPDDNPFTGQSSARAEIWSYGHRNPQGLCYDKQRHGLWSSEHGPRGGDEINWILPGANYGWPLVSHGQEYWGPVSIGEGKEKSGIEPPRHVYIPSIAPGSLLCYDGAISQWQGKLLLGALAMAHLNVITITNTGELGSEQRLLEDLGERIRSLVQAPDGDILVGTDSGRILRLAPPP